MHISVTSTEDWEGVMMMFKLHWCNKKGGAITRDVTK
jgi:hypothetical protein